jgi:predicted nucleotidyltransferase
MKLDKKIVDILLGRYTITPATLGIILFGSAVRGGFDVYSDIDVYVLQKNKPRYGRESYKVLDTRIDVILNSLEEVRDYLKGERHHVYRNTSHMLAHGEIIYASGSSMKHIQISAIENLKSKTRYTNDESLMHLYSINDFYGEVLRYSEKKEIFSFEQNSNLLVNNTLEFFLKLKGEYFRRPNELAPLIKKLDGNFARALFDYYAASNIKTKVKSLTVLVNRIHKLAHRSLPDTWKVR